MALGSRPITAKGERISKGLGLAEQAVLHEAYRFAQFVTEASAKSYRLMQAMGRDPFNFTQVDGTAEFLTKALTPGSTDLEGDTDLSNFVGRYPGSWTVPVCNAGNFR